MTVCFLSFFGRMCRDSVLGYLDDFNFQLMHFGCVGPTFYTKAFCPICETCCRNVICSRCVKTGIIFPSNSTNETIWYVIFVWIIRS